MKKLILAFLMSCAFTTYAQEIVKKMYKAHAKDFRKSLSFVQQTGFYLNDSLVKKAIWYEALVYPDKLRIDIDSASSGNIIFFVNDSAYQFQKNKLRSKGYQQHDLLFVLGGMYSYPLDTVFQKLKAFGYNTDKTFETTWKGKKVVVVGTDKEETESNQFWIDKDKLVTVRILNNKNKQKTETLCEDYVKLGKGWCETTIKFYVNGKLRQSEKYTEIKENVKINMDFLDPYKLGQVSFWNQD